MATPPHAYLRDVIIYLTSIRAGWPGERDAHGTQKMRMFF